MRLEQTPVHHTILASRARYRAVVAGRRFGKTHDLLIWLNAGAIEPFELRWYIAPSYRLAKRVGWSVLKRLYRAWGWSERMQLSETELTATFPNGAQLTFIGAENVDGMRGVGLARAGFEEAAYIKPDVWPEIVTPMLTDTGGSAMFIGTPDGMNWFYDIYLLGQDTAEEEWTSWQFASVEGGYIPIPEIEKARARLDERTFRQEFLGTFETQANRVFYPFHRQQHLVSRPDLIGVGLPVSVGIDFNVDYLTAECFVVLPQRRIHFVDEIRLARADTFQMAERLCQAYPQATVYPDPTGKHRSTAATRSDHDILRQAGFIVKARRGYPPQRALANAVNRLLKGADGAVRLTIEPQRCPNLVTDLERVTWTPNGEFDKQSDPARSHASDAAAIAVDYLFPIQSQEVTYGQRW